MIFCDHKIVNGLIELRIFAIKDVFVITKYFMFSHFSHKISS